MKKQLAVLGLTGLLLAGWMIMPRYSVQPGAKLRVEGTSTVHAWECTFGSVNGTVEAEPGAAPTAAQISVAAKSIECKNGTMNKKAVEALKASAHPNVTFDLQRMEPAGTDTYKATGRLTLAGTAKPLTMTVKVEPTGADRLRITGQTPLQMTDFGMSPPTAMLGTLKTGNRVVVHFDVVVAR